MTLSLVVFALACAIATAAGTTGGVAGTAITVVAESHERARGSDLPEARIGARDVLERNRIATDDGGKTGTLKVTYAYSGQGLVGVASRTYDVASGDFVESYVAGPIGIGSGYDGITPWMRDASGAFTAERGGDRVALAVNAAYLNGNRWWLPGFARATVRYAGREKGDGRTLDHLIVVPDGGKRFDAWFDSRSHLLTQIAEVSGFFATRTTFAEYERRSGRMLPRVTIIDVGLGKANEVRLELRGVAFISTLPNAAYARPTRPPTGATIANGTSRATLPFRLLNNHIYIDASVNGKGPFTFIVDTGGHTLLSPRLSSELRLNSQGKAASSGVGAKTASTGFAKVREIAIGGVRMHDQTAFVTNVYDASVEGIPVDGMVGFELFRRFAVTIDYGHRTLTFYDPNRFVPSNAGRAVRFDFYDHLPDVRGTIDGIPARFDIDTGSRSELDLTSPFVSRNRLRSKFPGGVDALTGWGVGGAVRSYVVRMPALTLGDVRLSGPVVGLSDAKKGSFSDANYDGNIGTALLKRFVVTFDYARQMLYLRPIVPIPSDFGTFDRSGLWINAAPAGFVVTAVDTRSPAANAGLTPGDVITALDNEPARMQNLSEARKALRVLPAGTVVRIDYRRGSLRKTTRIRLRDLL